MRNSISILIPTHNRADVLQWTLESVRKIETPSSILVDLLVVANGCTDHTSEVCKEMLPTLPFPARMIPEPKLGLNNARNTAVTQSRGEIVAFLDDDVFLQRDWLVHLASAYDDPTVDLLAGRVRLRWEEPRPAWLSHQFDSFLSANNLGDEPRQLHDFPGVVGANLSFRRKVYDNIGAFRSNLDRIGRGMLGFGESEFVVRAISKGHRLMYAPQVCVEHWTPRERASFSYIRGAATGFSQARILAKEHFGIKTALRCVAGHSYLLAKSGIREIAAIPTRDMQQIMKHRLGRVSAQAALTAAIARCCGRRQFLSRAR